MEKKPSEKYNTNEFSLILKHMSCPSVTIILLQRQGNMHKLQDAMQHRRSRNFLSYMSSGNFGIGYLKET
jgi:hypothetical protein